MFKKDSTKLNLYFLQNLIYKIIMKIKNLSLIIIFDKNKLKDYKFN